MAQQGARDTVNRTQLGSSAHRTAGGMGVEPRWGGGASVTVKGTMGMRVETR